MEPMLQPLRRRIAELEEMNASLQKRLGETSPEVVSKEAATEGRSAANRGIAYGRRRLWD